MGSLSALLGTELLGIEQPRPDTVSRRVQEVLGATQPRQQGMVESALSSRFQPEQQQQQQSITAKIQELLNTPEMMDSVNTFEPQNMSDTYGAIIKSAPRNAPIMTGGDYYNDRISQGLSNISKMSDISRNLSAAQTGGTGGATIAAAREIMASTGVDFPTAYSMAKSGMGQGNTFVDGKIQNIAGAPDAFGAIKYGQKTGTDTAEADVKRRGNLTKAQSALRGFESQSKVVLDNINKAKKVIAAGAGAFGFNSATGVGNIIGGMLPNSDARALNNYINTIKANVGFDKLQSMREASPTGGALGQVTDFENKLLQAINGALDPLQKDQLIDNLTIIEQLYPQVLQERQRAFQQDYENYAPIGNNPIPQQSVSGGLNQSDPRVAEALRQGYTPQEIQTFLGGR